MVHISNQDQDMVDHYLDGLCQQFPHLKRLANDPTLYNADQDPNIIPVLSGGGSGHEPAHAGFVGQGMLAAAIAGPIFIPPTAHQILRTIKFLDKGKGVFVIIKNFEADLLVFSEAIKKARQDGHQVKYVISHDDISVETDTFEVRHRGLAGTILLHKILGHVASLGASLDELEKLALHIVTNIATIGFATKAARLPRQTNPLFELPPKHISYGIGIHGENGYRTVPFQSSEDLANEIVNKLKLFFRWRENESFILLVNNLGTTTELEMGIFINDLQQLLSLEGLNILFVKSGRYMTSLDMSGISVTLCRIQDPAWLDHLAAPTTAFAW